MDNQSICKLCSQPFVPIEHADNLVATCPDCRRVFGKFLIPPGDKINYIEKADLIALAKEGKFDVIAHGINCFCTQGKGLAYQMDRSFSTKDADLYPMEDIKHRGKYNKLGCIEFVTRTNFWDSGKKVTVINCYTQYKYGNNPKEVYLDYEALAMCLKKINHEFAGLHIGLPKIGCGYANGDWDEVKWLINKYLVDMDVTVINSFEKAKSRRRKSNY